MKGYRDEAKESMQFVYKGNVNDEFERMADTINNMCCREDSADDEVEIDQCDSFFGDERKKGGSIDNQEAFPDDEDIDANIDDDKPQGMFSKLCRKRPSGGCAHRRWENISDRGPRSRRRSSV